MIDASTITALFSAFGLSGAGGLNAWLPLLLVALLGRAGWIDLDPAFADLIRTPVILALGALFALDFVADKVPAVDHAMHTAGLAIHPIAGAALFDVQATGDSPLLLNLLLGAGVAGTIHMGRAAARPAINLSSGGLGAPFVSALEDFASLVLVIAAFALPVMAGLAVLVMLVGAVIIGHRARVALRRRKQLAATPRYPTHQRRGGNEPPAPRRR